MCNTEPGTTWANEMNFVMNHVLGAGSILDLLTTQVFEVSVKNHGTLPKITLLIPTLQEIYRSPESLNITGLTYIVLIDGWHE